MNPFVGLSKVTKKRLDALENITKEVDTIKSRVGDLESSIEKGGGILGDSKKKGLPAEMIKTPSNDNTSETTTTPSINPTGSPTSSTEAQVYQSLDLNLSEIELDEILSKSLEALRIEQNIDTMINEFFLNLK